MAELRKLVAAGIAFGFLLSGIIFSEETKGEVWDQEDAFVDTYDLKYMTFSPPAPPETMILESGGNIGLYTSLGMKVVENPPNPPEYYARISYYNATNGDLRYAYEDAEGWHILVESIDYVDDVGMYSSIAIGSDDYARVSYYDATNGDLKFAKETAGGWNVETVYSLGDVGKYTSIGLDTGDNPHISFYDVSNGNLRYAHDPGTGWVFDDVDTTNNVGLYTSIAVDSLDHLHISYYDETDRDLKYAFKGDGAWQVADPPLETAGNVGQYTSIAIDSSDKPHIGYYKAILIMDGELWYKYKDTLDVWQQAEPVDSGGNVGLYTSIVIDSSDVARISYYDQTNGNLKMAHRTGGTWQAYPVDTEGDVGLWTSLELDEDDNEFVSYGVVSILYPRNPVVATGCDKENGCEHVHMVWVEPEIVLGDPYERIYYRRSSDGGGTWDIPPKPISSLVKNPNPDPPDPYRVSRPSISVVSEAVHVAWLRDCLCTVTFCYSSVYYQRSSDNGESWIVDDLTKLPKEVEINDLMPNGYPGIERVFADESLVSIAASDSYVHVVWQNEYFGRSTIYHDKSLVAEAHQSSKWGGEVGEYSSIAVDPQGRPYIGYYDSTYSGLKFSSTPLNPFGLFEAQTVDGSENVGKYASIALDDEDHPYPHISYYDETNGKLKYAKWNGNFWEFVTPDISGDNVGKYTSIALDSYNNPHISYYDETNRNLKYAYLDAAGWHYEDVDTGGDVGLYSSIAIDLSDQPHISYYDQSNKNLKYAHDPGPGWVFDEIVTSNDDGLHTSIALDSNDDVHISYYDADDQNLLYVYNLGSPQIVDGSFPNCDEVGDYTSLALDSQDPSTPYISYYDKTHETLKYAYWNVDHWDSASPDTSGDNVGWYTSIALDKSDKLHISYYDVDNKRLKYYYSDTSILHTVQNDEILSAPLWDMDKYRSGVAWGPDITEHDGELHVTFQDRIEPIGDLEYAYFDPDIGSGEWRFESPDEEGVVGGYSSVALEQGTWLPHISHYDFSHGDLRHSWKDNSGIWHTESVDTEGDVGLYTTIALEASSPYYPHIAYYDVGTKEPRYAYKDSNGWTLCTIDPFQIKGPMSMALDSNNHAHISFPSWDYGAFYHVLFTPTPINPCENTWDKPVGTSHGARHTSIAVDGNDNPHISYLSHKMSDMTFHERLRYVYSDGTGVWHDEPVDIGLGVGWYNSLALEDTSPDYYPHISYYDMRRGNLKYAYKDINGWHPEGAIDAEGDVGLYTSLALEPNQPSPTAWYPHISYTDSTNGYLKYAYKDSADNWHIVTVDGSHQGVGLYTGIALKPDSWPSFTAWYPHISHYDEGSGQGIIHKKGPITGQGAWTPEAVVSERFAGQPQNPAAETMGDNLLVVWQDDRDTSTSGKEIYYKKSSSWDVWPAPIDTKGDVGKHTSIATDSYGYSRMSYYDASNGDLRFAYEDGDGWHVWPQPIDYLDDVGLYTSIAVDSSDRARISYCDANGNLKHAYQDNNDNWEVESSIDPNNHYCYFTSIAIGSDDYSRISYFDGLSAKLKYAENSGGGWSITEIDGGNPPGGDPAGFFSSIALDYATSLYARISYCDVFGNLKYAYEVGVAWHIWPTPVDTGGCGPIDMGGGGYTSIAVDSFDHARISYYDNGNNDLKYAYEDEGGWNVWPTPIDSTGDVGRFSSVAIDSDGYSRISYYDADEKNLKYAYENARGWHVQPEPIDSYGDVGKHTSIALDSSGYYARISYYDVTNNNLKYAYQDTTGLGNSWAAPDSPLSDGDTSGYPYQTDSHPRIASAGATAHVVWQKTEWGYEWETLDNPLEWDDDVGQYVSVGNDVYNALQVSYFEPTFGDGALWWKGQHEITKQWHYKVLVDNSGNDIVGQYNSMDIASNQRPHFSYWDETNDRLKYAYLDIDRDPHVDVVDSLGTVGKYTSIGLDSKDRVHISYYDYGPANTNLRYASGQYGNWAIDTNVDPMGTTTDIGQYSSLAVDSKDRPHISYYDQTNGNLKYAYFDGSSWNVVSDIDLDDSGNDLGYYTSIALDAQNHPHISYFDDTADKLKCAHFDGNNWIVDIVDSETNFGVTSLTIDSEEYAHISYYDADNQNLKYAFEDANGWHIFTIDSTGVVGQYSSIVLGPYYWHITYYDGDNGDLEYAKETQPILESGDIYYDENRFDGDPSKWGEDSLIIPFGVPGLSYRYAVPDISAVGNDRHIVYEYSYETSSSSRVHKIGYSHRIDSIAEKNPFQYLKGTSAVRAPVQWLGRDQIFIIGGVIIELPPYYINTVYRYDPYTDTYTFHCNLPYPYGIAYTSAVYDPNAGLNGEIFVFGGLSFDHFGQVVQNEIMRINPHERLDCTGPVVSLPTSRYGTSAVYLSNPLPAGDGILVFGGYDEYGYEVDDITWWQPGIATPANLLVDFQSGRAFTSAITMTTDREYAYVFGGEQYVGGPSPYIYLNEVVKVYHSGIEWVVSSLEHTAFPMGEGRSRTSAISDGTYGYIFGGKDFSHGILNDIIRFNPRVDSGTAMIELCTELPSAREHTSAAYYGSFTGVWGGGTYVFGGGVPGSRPNVYQYGASYDYDP